MASYYFMVGIILLAATLTQGELLILLCYFIILDPSVAQSTSSNH